MFLRGSRASQNHSPTRSQIGACRKRRRRFAPGLLPLEARALLSTLTVTNDDDSGTGLAPRRAGPGPERRHHRVLAQGLRHHHPDQRPARGRDRRQHPGAGRRQAHRQRRRQLERLRRRQRRDGLDLGDDHHRRRVAQLSRSRRDLQPGHADPDRRRRHRQLGPRWVVRRRPAASTTPAR